MNTRNRKFFHQLTPLKNALDVAIVSNHTTDRGLTGPAARDGDDVRTRLEKRAQKLARRAKLASGALLVLMLTGCESRRLDVRCTLDGSLTYVAYGVRWVDKTPRGSSIVVGRERNEVEVRHLVPGESCRVAVVP